MKKSWWLLLAALSLVCSCAQRIKMQVSNPGYQTDSVTTPVRVLSLNDTVPAEAVLIGTLKIGDNGFSKSGNLDTTLRLAREHAAKAGGNLVKITWHKAPSFASSCHRIKADIYRMDSLPPVETHAVFDSLHFLNGESVIHLFRKFPLGAALSYDVKINDSVVTQARNNWAEEIVIPATGEVVIWASTENRAELKLILQAGYHYYIRCGMKYGIMVGRPKLEIVEPSVAKAEIEAIQQTAPDPDTDTDTEP